jgi:UDP-glucose 4-epimerase
VHLLVVGGAGYIGSVTVAEALAAGHRITVYDSLVTGHRAAISPAARFVQGDFGDAAALGRLLSEDRPDGVVFYGGFIAAGESMEKPGLYFVNNISGVITLLNALVDHGVRRFVFSSSAAVFGDPETIPIPEDALLAPTNPYAETKVVVERLLAWYDSRCGLRSVSLRYFNAAGATETLGEDHRPETHLIPTVLQVALGRHPALDLYGTDYPTPDGTCVRDYVHVVDLARAHLLALARCDEGSAVYNLGNGRGFSNRQVIEAARSVTGRPIPLQERPRRPGDPVTLIASSEKARRDLGWEPQLPRLEDMIESAWRWHQAYPEGYPE